MKWYRKNKQRQIDRQAERRKTAKAWLSELKANPCTDCGVQYPPYIMEFDHLPEYEKKHDVTYMVGGGWSREAIAQEIEKCELVCSNCHGERTHQRRK